jgi:hypothetical protein
MLERLTVDDFTGTEGQPYAAELEGHGTLTLELISTEPGGDPRPFSLIFRGPLEPQLPQGIYPVTHPALDQKIPLFLVPIARGDDGLRYEVIFG